MWTCFLGGDEGRLGELYLVAKLGQTRIDLHQAVLWNHPCLQRDTETVYKWWITVTTASRARALVRPSAWVRALPLVCISKLQGSLQDPRELGKGTGFYRWWGKGWLWVCPGYCHTGLLSKLSWVLWNPGQALAAAYSALSIFQEVRLRWNQRELEVTQVLPWPLGAADGASGLDTSVPLGQM